MSIKTISDWWHRWQRWQEWWWWWWCWLQARRCMHQLIISGPTRCAKTCCQNESVVAFHFHICSTWPPRLSGLGLPEEQSFFLLLHGYQVKAVSFLFNLWIVVPMDNIGQGQLNFIDFSSSVQAHSMRLNFCGVVLLWQRVQQNNGGGHFIMTSDKASQGVFQYHQNHTRHACDIQSRDKGSCVTRRGQFIE